MIALFAIDVLVIYFVLDLSLAASDDSEANRKGKALKIAMLQF